MQIDHDYQEIVLFTASLLIHIIRGLQHNEKYQSALQLVKRVHSSAGTLKVGSGKLERISFETAKELLRTQGGMTAVSDQENLTLVSVYFVISAFS